MSQTLKQAFEPIVGCIRSNSVKKAQYNIVDIDFESIDQDCLDQILNISLNSNSKYKNLPFASLINLADQMYRSIKVNNYLDESRLENISNKARMLLKTVKTYVDSGKSTRDFNTDEAYLNVLRTQIIADVNLNERYDYTQDVYSLEQIKELNLNNLGWYQINLIKLNLANERFLYEVDTTIYTIDLVSSIRSAAYKWNDLTKPQQANLLSKTLYFAARELQGNNVLKNIEILLEPLDKNAPEILKELKLISSLGIDIGKWTRAECLSCLQDGFNAQTIPFEI